MRGEHTVFSGAGLATVNGFPVFPVLDVCPALDQWSARKFGGRAEIWRSCRWHPARPDWCGEAVRIDRVIAASGEIGGGFGADGRGRIDRGRGDRPGGRHRR